MKTNGLQTFECYVDRMTRFLVGPDSPPSSHHLAAYDDVPHQKANLVAGLRQTALPYGDKMVCLMQH